MKNFNIRVYGLLINKYNHVLISDEKRGDFTFSKFPGGGLEFGEGIKEALIREFQEELSIDIEVGELFYFNEHFQESAFNQKQQLFSFYYLVTSAQIHKVGLGEYQVPLIEDGENQRWMNISTSLLDLMIFPLDKIAVSKLIEINS